MCKLIIPPAWREAVADLNRDYLRNKRDRTETVLTVIAFVLILGGLFLGAWAWGT